MMVTGIDVSKAMLDVAIGEGPVHRFANSGPGIRGLLRHMARAGATQAVCEATGGYERGMGLPCGQVGIRSLGQVSRQWPCFVQSMKLANMNPQLRDLLQVHTNGLVSDIDTLVQRSNRNFDPDLIPLWVRVDEQIPGPGLQYSYWKPRHLPDYLFDYEFEQVLRPLRYVVHFVYGLFPPGHTRALVADSGGHLEGCVKDLCGVTRINQPKFRTAFLPLGGLVKRHPFVRLCLGKDVCDAITTFCQLLWNPAKHKYETRHQSPDPMIPFADAVAGYFLARALGAEVLRASGHLEPVVQAIRNEQARLADRID